MEGAMQAAAQPTQAQPSAGSAVVDVESSEPSAAGPKVRTPQIHWHGKSPVFAIDFHPHFASLCVTGGLEPDGTGGVHLWIVNDGEKADKAPVSFVQGLEGHEKAVNCLRFCPKGDLLASAGVEGIVIIWRRTAVAPSPSAAVAGHEKWEFLKMLRAHTLDVADLSWSPSCTQLATASVDHTAVVFNLRPNKEKVGAHIRGHVDYALGVAWDPKEEYILTTSSDGSTRMHVSKSGKWKADARTLKIADRMEFPKKNDNRSIEPDVQSEGLKGSTGFKMFVDGTLAVHRRRAAWSPDGLFAVVPAGLYQKNASSAPFYVTHVLARRNPDKAFAILPSGRKPSVAVRFCPLLFKLSRSGDHGAAEGRDVPTPEKLFATPLKDVTQATKHTGFNMPYKMVFAVATANSICLYDTELMRTPFMYVNGIHFDAITDLAWSKDGQHLVATSKDGYCTMIEFKDGELGEPLEHDCLPPVVAKNLMPGKSIDLSIVDEDDQPLHVASEETAAQKLAEMVAAPVMVEEPEVIEWKEGDKVQARWKGGTWYVGTVTKVNEPEVPETKEAEPSQTAGPIDLVAPAALEVVLSEPPKPAKTYAILFDDGDFDPAVPFKDAKGNVHIKAWEDRRARKRRIVPQVVKPIEDVTTNSEAQPIGGSDHNPETNPEEGRSHEMHRVEDSLAKDVAQLAPESVADKTHSLEETMGNEINAQPSTVTGEGNMGSAKTDCAELTSEQQQAASAPKKRRIIPATIIAPAP